MARAKQNSLRRSRIELDRQQRQDEVEVPGASGSPEDVSREAAMAKASKRRGKTEKHTSGDGSLGAPEE